MTKCGYCFQLSYILSIFVKKNKMANIGSQIIRGAATQFGREFGRAAANSVLKGANYYNVKNSTSSSKDKEIDKTIAQIKRIDIGARSSTNIARCYSVLYKFETLLNLKQSNEIENIILLVDTAALVSEKIEFLSKMIDDDKLTEVIVEAQKVFQKLDDLVETVKRTVNENYNNTVYKSKKTAVLLAVFGAFLGLHGYYLNKFSSVIYLLLIGMMLLFGASWKVIGISIVFINVFRSLIFLGQSKSSFDNYYNEGYVYYKSAKEILDSYVPFANFEIAVSN